MPRPLRVASIYSSLVIGGDTSRLLAYLAARDRNRFEHIVFGGMSSFSEWEQLTGPAWDRFRALDVQTADLGIPARHLYWRTSGVARRRADQVATYFRLVRKIAEALREHKVDIVDGRLEMGTALATLAGRLAGVRAVVSTSYFPWTGGERWFTRKCPLIWSLFGQGVFGLVDAVVCDSDANLKALRKSLMLPPPGYCIPNGIERPRAERPAKEVALQLRIPGDAIVIGQVARVTPHKGQHLLLEAAPSVLAQCPEAFFLIVGYSTHTPLAVDYRDRLEKLVRTRGVGDRVRMISYSGSVGDIWQVVAIHAHPTLLDSSPIALLEGMSLGKPAITSRIGGIHELVIDGETGIIVPPNDVEALTTALLRVLKDPAEAARLGRNAMRRYETNYTVDIMARRTEAMFEQVYAHPRIHSSARASRGRTN